MHLIIFFILLFLFCLSVGGLFYYFVIKRKLIHNNANFVQFIQKDTPATLPNDAMFNNILNKAINHTKRRKKTLAILYIEISHFENHSAIKQVEKKLAETLRAEDVIASLSGNEFIVLLNDIGNPKFAGIVAEKIVYHCAAPSITHIGIAVYPKDGDAIDVLLKNSKNALNQAKQLKQSGYHFYSDEMDRNTRHYIALSTDLAKAIEEHELALHYQPKFRLKKGHIMGVEALMRWENSKFGIIHPSRFLPVAEETGLSMRIGAWALYEACQKIKSWHDEGYEHITVAVNISPKQFHHPEFVTVVADTLKNTGLSPHYLELEIHEQAVMGDIDGATQILDKLKEINVQIALDHFGTGYTSISHLKQFPINTIKIDPSFIKGIPHHPNDSAITSALIALAHPLGLEVVASGVETAEQLQYLANQHCDIVQGHFLGPPVSSQKLIEQCAKLMEGVFNG